MPERQLRNPRALYRPRRHRWPDRSASDLWRHSCGLSNRRSSGNGAQGARCRSEQWCRESRVDRVREALEAVDNGDEDVFDAAIAQVVHHREPEFGPFISRDPQAQNLAFTFGIDAQGHVNGLILDLTAFHCPAVDCAAINERERRGF